MRALPGIQELTNTPDISLFALQRAVIKGLRQLPEAERTLEHTRQLNWHETNVIFETKSHLWLVDGVCVSAKQLAAGQVLATGGIVSRVFTGSRGVGKTTCMQVFSRLCPLLLPSVVTIYCDVRFAVRYGYVDDVNLLEKLMIHALERAGVPLKYSVGVEGEYRISSIIKDLEENDRYLLIQLDDFDNLHNMETGAHCASTMSIDMRMKFKRNIIAVTNVQGPWRSQRLFCVLCDPSVHLSALVQRNFRGNPAIEEKFSTVNFAFKINASKFPVCMVPSPLPHDVNAVHTSLETWAQYGVLNERLPQQPEQLQVLASMLAFEFGTASRAWMVPLSYLVEEHRMEGISLLPVIPRMKGEVFAVVMKELLKQNKELLLDLKSETFPSPLRFSPSFTFSCEGLIVTSRIHTLSHRVCGATDVQ